MRAFLLGITILFVNAFVAFGQRSLAFEVAAIKPSKSRRTGTSHISAHQPIGNTFTAQNATARLLTMMAFNLAAWQISGAPDWFDSEGFDIQAKPEHPASREEIYAMVRTLLADRFHLVMHAESRNLPIYKLVLDKRGPKIAINQTGGPPRVSHRPGHAVFRNVPIMRLTTYLSTEVGRAVVDETALTGNYDFTLDYAPTRESSKSADASGPTIFDALKNQLGMRLQRGRGAVEIFCIDHIERPSEN